jgi:hypothetical protein
MIYVIYSKSIIIAHFFSFLSLSLPIATHPSTFAIINDLPSSLFSHYKAHPKRYKIAQEHLKIALVEEEIVYRKSIKNVGMSISILCPSIY